MLTVFRIAFGAVCSLKALSFSCIAVSLLVSGASTETSFRSATLALCCGLLMTAASIALMLGYRARVAATAVVATGCAFLIPLGAYNHHLYLLILIALILAVDVEVELLLPS